MYAGIVELKELDFERVKFYSVLIEGRRTSEFMDFVGRMEWYYPSQVKQLLELIEGMGEIGARRRMFRDEKAADALPPEYFHFSGESSGKSHEFGLRLDDAIKNRELTIGEMKIVGIQYFELEI